MATLILHKDGAYNLYSTIVDDVLYEGALTAAALEAEIRNEYGAQGLRELPDRLVRAHKRGCSSQLGQTLEQCIAGNRENLSVDAFVARYLTLPPVR